MAFLGVSFEGFELRTPGPISFDQIVTTSPRFTEIMTSLSQTLTAPGRRAELHRRLAVLAQRIIQDNFYFGGRPVAWKPRKDPMPGTGTLLRTQELLRSVDKEHSTEGATVFTTLVKAPSLNFGGVVGRGAILPPRPFMVIPQETVVVFEREAERFLTQPGKDPFRAQPNLGGPVPGPGKGFV